jgi:hypothetical protein
VVKDPAWLSSTVVAALKKVGRRAIIQAGWAGLDTDTLDIPEYIKVIMFCHILMFCRISPCYYSRHLFA